MPRLIITPSQREGNGPISFQIDLGIQFLEDINALKRPFSSPLCNAILNMDIEPFGLISTLHG